MTKDDIISSDFSEQQVFEDSASYADSVRELSALTNKNYKTQVHTEDYVLILDDQSTGLKLLTQILLNMDKSLAVHAFTNPFKALKAAEFRKPALVISDYRMPAMDGLDFVRRFRQISGCDDIPLIIVTICEDVDIRYKVLDAGATDFLTRPLDHYECKVRCQNLLKLSRQQNQIKSRKALLEEKVNQATEEIRQREYETLMRLAKAGEYRDEETGMHVVRMAKISYLIAQGLGLSAEECHDVEIAAPMHDIGKIGISDKILLKNGRLDEGEMELMRQHTIIGHEILKDSPSRYLQMGAEIALAHHERWDGTGYPHQLRGEEIPLIARIVAVADVFDALCSKRPYKEAWNVKKAIDYVRSQSGKHFDPGCVDAFINDIDNIVAIGQKYPD